MSHAARVQIPTPAHAFKFVTFHQFILIKMKRSFEEARSLYVQAKRSRRIGDALLFGTALLADIYLDKILPIFQNTINYGPQYAVSHPMEAAVSFSIIFVMGCGMGGSWHYSKILSEEDVALVGALVEHSRKFHK
jgi:hypothetical protein